MNISKLKNKILQLAIEGKLVEQNPDDEPVEVLLERIAEEREKLIKEKKIKKEKPLPEIIEEEKPFELPKGWEWVRFAQITFCRDGERVPVSSKDRSEREKVYDYYGASGVIDKIDSYIFDKPLLLIGEDGANLISRSTPIAFIANGKYWVNNHAHVIDSLNIIILKYLEIYINAIDLKPYVTGTAQPKLNQANLNNILVPLPSVAEQFRIVNKVDELFAIIDELAENKEAMLKDISNTRNKVLQLAIQGKLVEQDENDEPVAILLERIAEERERLIKEKKIKKEKPLPEITEEEKPFELPKGWEWVRLNNISKLITDGAHSTPHYTESGVPFISVKDITNGIIDFSDTKFISKEEHEILTKRCNPEFGDVLLTKIGTTGIAKVVDTTKEFSIFVSVALLKLFNKQVNENYIELVLNSPFVKKQSKDNTQGVGNKNLVIRCIKSFIIPLPSIAEQQRIVQKVNEIMAYLDELEKTII